MYYAPGLRPGRTYKSRSRRLRVAWATVFHAFFFFAVKALYLVIVNIQAYIPKGPLKEFVDIIHFISGKESGTGVAFPRMHQVIIINLGARFSSSDVYAPEANSVVHETSSTVWINGKQDNPFLLGNAGITAMYAIGLKLGMVPYFANLPAIKTNNVTLEAKHWTSHAIF